MSRRSSVRFTCRAQDRPVLVYLPRDFVHKLTYGNESLQKSEFEFNFPAGVEPGFELFLQTEKFVKTELSKIPDKTGTVKILDPIFGDEVQAVRFKNVKVGD